MREGEGSSPSTNFKILYYLREMYAAAYVGLRIYFRYPMWIVSDLLTSPIWMLVLLIPILLFMPPESWGSGETIQYFFWGMVLWDVVSTALWGIGNSIRSEQQLGTLEQLLLTNANRAILFTRRLASRMLGFATSTAYMYIFLQLFFGKPIIVVNLPGVILLLIIAAATATGFGLVYGAVVLWIKNPGPLSNILQFVLIGLSGIFYPIARMPAIIQYAAYAIPFTYLADLLRHEAMGTPTLLQPILEYALLMTYTAALNAVGYVILLKIEERMKRVGKLGVY